MFVNRWHDVHTSLLQQRTHERTPRASSPKRVRAETRARETGGGAQVHRKIHILGTPSSHPFSPVSRPPADSRIPGTRDCVRNVFENAFVCNPIRV